jgi:ABC-type transport system involved in multi-copper enzyme maturation permease subunit
MTLTAQRPTGTAQGDIAHVGVPGLRLIRSEFRKITTTNAWWLFGLASVVLTGLATWANIARGNGDIHEALHPSRPLPIKVGMSADQIAAVRADYAEHHDLHLQLVRAAGSIFTSGQFLGLVLVMLLGVLVITNEFQYQTATATFLTTPRRSRVVVGKLVAALGLAFLFWLISQLVSLIAGLIFFNNLGLTNSLGDWSVQRAMLFNGAAYLLWAIFGFGLGTLIRSQIGSVVTAMIVYLIGFAGGIAVFSIIHDYIIHRDGVLTAAVIMPSIASQIMISPDKLYDQSAVWWVGALVMIGWSALAGTIGLLLTRRRDIA